MTTTLSYSPLGIIVTSMYRPLSASGNRRIHGSRVGTGGYPTRLGPRSKRGPQPGRANVEAGAYWTIRGLPLNAVTAVVVASSRLRWALTSSGGVSASHWLSEMSAKWSLRNISRNRTGSVPVLRM